jgi:hypothetical protein
MATRNPIGDKNFTNKIHCSFVDEWFIPARKKYTAIDKSTRNIPNRPADLSSATAGENSSGL